MSRNCSKHNDCKGMLRQEQAQWPVCSCCICWSCTQFYAWSSNSKGFLIIVFRRFVEYYNLLNLRVRVLNIQEWLYAVSATADVYCCWQICGIGKVTEKMLAALGIVTCSQLCEHRDILYYLYSPSSFDHFMQITLGIGSTRVERYITLYSVLLWLWLTSLVTECTEMYCYIAFIISSSKQMNRFCLCA